MGVLLEFLFFLALGFIVGIFVYAQILLPLIYSFPKSIFWFIKGRLRFLGVLTQLITPVLWIVSLLLLWFLFQAISPSTSGFLITNEGFRIGQLLSIVALIIYFFSRRGRSDMADDFFVSTAKIYGKSELSLKEGEKCETHNSKLCEFSVPYSYNYVSISDRLALRNLSRKLDAFPNAELAVAHSRFEFNGKVFFRFTRCSACRREYYSLLLNNLSGYSVTDQERVAFHANGEIASGDGFGKELLDQWEHLLERASDASRTGGLMSEEVDLLKLASYRGDCAAIEVIIDEIATRPAFDPFVEPFEESKTNLSIVGDQTDEQLYKRDHELISIDSKILADDISFLNDNGTEALKKRIMGRLKLKAAGKQIESESIKLHKNTTTNESFERLRSEGAVRTNAGKDTSELASLIQRIEISKGRILKGTGQNIEDAFVVEAANSAEAILTEYKQISKIEGVLGLDWVVIEQSSISSGNVFFDEITIRTRNDGMKVYYFDVTSAVTP